MTGGLYVILRIKRSERLLQADKDTQQNLHLRQSAKTTASFVNR